MANLSHRSLMNTLWIQIAAALIMLSAAAIAVRFKLALPKAASPSRSHHEPAWLKYVINIVAAFLGVVTLWSTFHPTQFTTLPTIVVIGLQIAAAVSGLLACGLMFLSLATLGTNFSGTSGTYSNHQLVLSGPYRYVRHPYYLATACIILSLSLLLGSIAVAFLGCLLLLALSIRSRAEDRELREKFGEAYEKWERNTGSFLPRIRSQSP